MHSNPLLYATTLEHDINIWSVAMLQIQGKSLLVSRRRGYDAGQGDY